MTDQQPQFEHDCDECVFLGIMDDPERGPFDVWAHFRSYREPEFRAYVPPVEENPIGHYKASGTTVRYVELIRRWSSDGPDYGSMTHVVGKAQETHPTYKPLALLALDYVMSEAAGVWPA